jgi:hypothetical protein
MSPDPSLSAIALDLVPLSDERNRGTGVCVGCEQAVRGFRSILFVTATAISPQ